MDRALFLRDEILREVQRQPLDTICCITPGSSERAEEIPAKLLEKKGMLATYYPKYVGDGFQRSDLKLYASGCDITDLPHVLYVHGRREDDNKPRFNKLFIRWDDLGHVQLDCFDPDMKWQIEILSV
jgi:hypothetical protein